MPFEEFKALQDMHTLFYILPKLPMVPSTDLRLSMRATTATYMAFLPSRAGKHSALDAATHCLAAAVRWCYANDLKGQGECDSQFGQSETEMLQHHSRALGKLRRALNDPKESLSAETLCATALLCCFESFSPSGSAHSLTQHLLGIEQVIKHRLPRRFVSQFELQLIQSNMGYLTFTAFFSNTKCFLHHKDWIPVYENIGSQFSEAKLLADYFIFSGPIFNLMVDCALLIQADDDSQEAVSRQTTLLSEVVNSGARFLDWYRSPDVQAKLPSDGFDPDSPRLTKGKVTQCNVAQFIRTCDATILLQLRLRIALDIRNSFWLEKACRKIAKNTLKAAEQQQNRPRGPYKFELSVPGSVLSTTDEWSSASFSPIDPGSKRNQALVPKEAYLRWAREMGVSIYHAR